MARKIDRIVVNDGIAIARCDANPFNTHVTIPFIDA
jgi:hypothetical protein